MPGRIQCFGGPCYLLAFGVPAILMLVALVFFVIGGLGNGYVKIPPQGSVFKGDDDNHDEMKW